MSASSNRSKGSRDPGEWKPPSHEAWCEYAPADEEGTEGRSGEGEGETGVGEVEGDDDPDSHHIGEP